jgi:hypothetical protein
MDQRMPIALNSWRAVMWETSVILFGHIWCLLYNFETKTWQKRQQFKTDVVNFGLVLDNQTIYIAGGSTYGEAKGNKWIWTCTDEIKSVSVLDIIQDKPFSAWKHCAKFPEPADVYGCCLASLPSKT